ncbi:GntR family transcriptional regulator [Bacillus sp. FJAT-29790]|uniref:GntR family transcriptional regulator n=1 Tax=Bacillus sp. FJAT-29790 TaxID=1895002 RepID=UPI001C248BCF|nr:GntR family transcriptional regulator [Bacillus sp. FJAT-29790]MBU8878610.1 GntR family transcriptional regulator [Bacillus sp. FJAT-29790]
MELDTKSPIPLHIQLKDRIKNLINEGSFHEKIPSERELMDSYKVSRSTVREAVSHLVREGVLEKVHGKGTFISMKPIEEWLGNLSSTTDTIRKMGMKPDAKLIEHGKVRPPKEIIDATGFEEAYYIKRIRFANDQPLAIEVQYYPVEIGEKLAQYDIEKGTLYDILEQKLHIKLAEAEQIITSSYLSKEDAKLLGVEESLNVLTTERLLMDIDDHLIEYYIASFRSDLYSFRIKLSKRYT